MRAEEGLVGVVRGLVTRVLDDTSYELVDLRISGQVETSASGGVVTLVIDKPGGVTSDDCVQVSRAVSRLLDAEDPIAGRYSLEVESPGLERPLRTSADFSRVLGHDIYVKCHGKKPFRGALQCVDDQSVTIDTPDGPATVPLQEVVRARRIINWEEEMRRSKQAKRLSKERAKQ